jgi:hypothetical protein
MLLNCSLVITVWQESDLAEVVAFGQTPWIVTTGAFGATLSGLKEGGAGCWSEGTRESGCAEGAADVCANAHVPARSVVIKVRIMNDETFLSNDGKKFGGDADIVP